MKMRDFSGGIMFHHFHGGCHIVCQGSISGEELYDMVTFLEKKYTIVDAAEWLRKACNEGPSDEEICLTFDDGLRCQYDIALPILNDLGIKAFWFIYSSPLVGVMEKLEVYRHFRFSKFASIEDFYAVFWIFLEKVSKQMDVNYKRSLSDFEMSNFCKEFAFYSFQDRQFRYFRDIILGQEKYYSLMDSLISYYGYKPHKELLWIDRNGIKDLYARGHIIGLHSHSHPTNLKSFDYEDQLREYRINSEVIESIIGQKPNVASYPCGSFNSDTVHILRNIGVNAAFVESTYRAENDIYHIPREDHANIMAKMNEGRLCNEDNSIYEQPAETYKSYK
ncbi:MAG: polysaccharide deacetylase family protein [Synergistaceae bacterium]|jgi:peptidoglycan/xylan/chitin deacetylase (PgdA/CDA1 family)|nr:polysaccharide deacetylase family protein [Synergistaceae bacterium]